MKLNLILILLITCISIAKCQPGQMQCSDLGTCPTDGSGSEFCWTLNDDNEIYTLEGNGCPNHSWGPPKNPNEAEIQNYSTTFHKNPQRAENSLNVGINGNPMLGPIGYALNSVPIFGPADALLEDAYVNEGQTFDDCLAHAAQCGTYHYHSESHCHQDTLSIEEDNSKHSPMFAIMLDGVPLFGARGANGVKPQDLDECGGHIGSGDDEYPFYHYHTQAQGSEYDVDNIDNSFYPYTVDKLCGCLHPDHGSPSQIPDSNVGDTCVLNSDQTGWGQGDLIWQAILDNIEDGQNCVNKNLGNDDDDDDDGLSYLINISAIAMFYIFILII